MEHLLGRALVRGPLVGVEPGERRLVGNLAPEPRRDRVLLDGLERRGDAGLAEVLLREDVGGDLGELLGHLDVGETEDDGAVRVSDLAGHPPERDGGERILSLGRESPDNAHTLRSPEPTRYCA
jgi:hypothetical protein